jgi:hypothetical protein
LLKELSIQDMFDTQKLGKFYCSLLRLFYWKLFIAKAPIKDYMQTETNIRCHLIAIALLLVVSLPCLINTALGASTFTPTLSVTGITQNSVSLSWSIYDGDIYQSYTMYMSLSGDNGTFTEIWNSGYSLNNSTAYWLNNSTLVTKLKPNTTYYFCVVDAGYYATSTSNIIKVTTLEAPTTTSPSSSPSPTPSVPEFSYLTILPILLTIPIALAIVRKRLERNV